MPLSGKNIFATQRATVVAIAIVTVITALASVVFYRQNLAIIDARDWVNHSYEVKVHIQDLLARERDAISGARIYMYTNDQTFLANYNDAMRSAALSSPMEEKRPSIAEEMSFLRRATADNQDQQVVLDRVEEANRDIRDYLSAALAQYKAKPEHTLADLDPRPVRQHLDKLRSLLQQMTDKENELLAQRNHQDIKSIRRNNSLIFTCIGIFYILLVLSVWIYQRMSRMAQLALLRYTQQLKLSEEDLKVQQEELQTSKEAIEASNAELEEQNEQIRNQARELRQSQSLLEEKASELEQASRYKTEFLANMSHELRTPLNSLLILSRSLAANEEGNLTPDQAEEASIIYNDGIELLNLINDILDLSKVEAGKMTVLPDTVAVDGIVDRLRQTFAALAREKKIAFPITVADTIPGTLYTDTHRVEQILKNLLSNAFKFTQTGSVTLRVGPAKEALPQGTASFPDDVVAFSVIDTGIGIDTSRFDDIFQAFQQAEGSTDRQYGGTGLGLTIARKLAQVMGGDICVESEKGKGSIFTLVLPPRMADMPADMHSPAASPLSLSLALPPGNAKRDQHHSSPAENEAPALGRAALEAFIPDDRRIITNSDSVLLIVEDDKAFAAILMKIARQRGFKCVVAGSGRSALVLAEEMHISAIILDLKLPDIDGIQVLEQLKRDLQLRPIPVHIISAMESVDEALRRGAVGFLTKPAAQEGIEEVLGRLKSMLAPGMKRILVVEDGKQNQVAIRYLLEKHDTIIVLADTGADGLAKLNDGAYDCVILDLRLPDFSGFEWLERAERALTPLRLPPVIVYTAVDLNEDEVARLRRFTDSIIIKGTKSPERLLDEVSLFLHSVESSLTAQQRDMIRARHDPNRDFSERTILLVDDDMRNTFALSRELKKHGLSVVIADNGQMALDRLAADKSIELAIMDIMMPVMDGYATMRAIRQDPARAQMPIIALTARAMPQEQAKCIEAGANDYLTKPIDIDRLLTLLRVWLLWPGDAQPTKRRS
jgi:CheY-like chemotaxis protein